MSPKLGWPIQGIAVCLAWITQLPLGRGPDRSPPSLDLSRLLTEAMMAYRKLRSPKVYIPNKSYHNYTKAEKFGELVFLTEGKVNKTKPNDIARDIAEAMKDAQANDFIMITSLSVICGLACGMFAHRFGRLNLLLHDEHSKEDAYLFRELVFGQGAQATSGDTNDRTSEKSTTHARGQARSYKGGHGNK